MKSTTVLYLYGPPAVGKLTVAQALSRSTGYALFHNHLTVDIATCLFPQGSAEFHRLIDRLRLDVFAAGIGAGLPGMIFTKMWDPARARQSVEFIEQVEALGCRVDFVRLFCAPSILEERVEAAERKRFGKLDTVAELRVKLAQLGNPFAEIPGRESLCIDTGKVSPAAAAEEITAYYGIPSTRSA